MRRRFKLNLKKNNSFGLNITSMTDVFTILLVFLLQSYGTSVVQIEQKSDLRLPSSKSDKNPVYGVEITLNKKELLLGKQHLANINNQGFESSAIDSNDSHFIKPLFKALQEIDAKKDNNKPNEGKIVFQADRELPYATLRKVMYTASMAGFPNVKLIIMVGN